MAKKKNRPVSEAFAFHAEMLGVPPESLLAYYRGLGPSPLEDSHPQVEVEGLESNNEQE